MISGKATVIISLILATLIFSGAFYFLNYVGIDGLTTRSSAYDLTAWQNLTGEEKNLRTKLVDAAIERTGHKVVYDPAYVAIDYPNGDVPEDQGVCADVIVRVYREFGIDLQKEVHGNFSN